MASSPDQTTNLAPKEHGAYAILAIPLATGLIVAGFTAVGLLIAVASVAGFLSHEPLLVAWGHRGGRALRASVQAKTRLWIQLSIAMTAGIAAVMLAYTPVRIALLACLLLAMVSFAVALKGKHRSLAGQLWGVVSLSAPCVPILLAGGIDRDASLSIWLIWLVGFTSTTVAVRGVIAKQKRQSRLLLLGTLMFASLVALISLFGGLDSMAAAIPMIAISWYLMLFPPTAKYLKRVGWTLVVGTIATGTIVALQFQS